MNTNDTTKPSLDAILESIRTEEPSRAEIEAAAGRVRAELGLDAMAPAAPTHIESCAGFQALIPAFLAGVVMGGALDASRSRYQKRLQWRARQVLGAR